MGYVDVYTLPDYIDRVSSLQKRVTSLNTEVEIIKREETLIQQIEVLEDKERQIFDILGVENVNQLNSRIKEFQSAVFNLSGPQLHSIFLKEIKQQINQTFADFNQDVMSIIEATLSQEGGSFEELGRQKALEAISTLLQSNNLGGKLRLGAGFGVEEISPSKFTKSQKKVWQQLIERAKSPEGIAYKDCGKLTINFQSHGEYEFYGNFNWDFGTFGYTKAQAREAFLPDSQILLNINSKMIQYISSQVSTNQEVVVDIIKNKILAKDPYAFFVGNNINDITGLLGEIQGLYYLHIITGGKANIEWTGGIAGKNGKKPHQDIILNEYFGIQVKNTTKDALKTMLETGGKGLDVGFQSASLDYFLSKISIDSNYKDILEEFYGTKIFNVPYHSEFINGKTRYVSGKGDTAAADIFQDWRGKLNSLTKQIDSFLEGFAAIYMYLDIETEALRMYDGNFLFLLGGAMFFTASQILTEVLAELRLDKKRFRIDASFSSPRTIIDALNSGAVKNYTSQVLSKVQLSSKFSF